MAAKKSRSRSASRKPSRGRSARGAGTTRATSSRAAKPVARKKKSASRSAASTATRRSASRRTSAARARPASRPPRQQGSGLRDLLVLELREIHNAENQLARVIPRLAKAADSDSLRAALLERLTEGGHIIMDVQDALERLGAAPGRRKNIAAEGLVSDLREHAQEIESGPALDTVLIAGLQKTSHYCIAAWGTARALAAAAGERQLVGAMERALEEGRTYDERLTELAEVEITPALAGQSLDAAAIEFDAAAMEEGSAGMDPAKGAGADYDSMDDDEESVDDAEGYDDEPIGNIRPSAIITPASKRRKVSTTVPFQSIAEDAENKQEQQEIRGRGSVRRGRDH
jgi:ferritin-like metal-binding protein YciE